MDVKSSPTSRFKAEGSVVFPVMNHREIEKRGVMFSTPKPVDSRLLLPNFFLLLSSVFSSIVEAHFLLFHLFYKAIMDDSLLKFFHDFFLAPSYL